MLMIWVCMESLALLLVSTVLLPGGLPCPSETHCTIPTSALVFGGSIFTHLQLKAIECIPSTAGYALYCARSQQTFLFAYPLPCYNLESKIVGLLREESGHPKEMLLSQALIIHKMRRENKYISCSAGWHRNECRYTILTRCTGMHRNANCLLLSTNIPTNTASSASANTSCIIDPVHKHIHSPHLCDL